MSGTESELETLARDLARYRSIAAPAALRSRVHSEIMGAPAQLLPSRRPAWIAVLRPGLAALLAVALLAGAGGTAAASLPGDGAFPIKRAVEDAQVALTLSDDARLDVLTDQLERRLAELEAVSSQRPGALMVALNEFAAALARVETQSDIVARLEATPARDAALSRAAASAEDHIARLRTLETRLPEAAQPGIERAIDAQQRISGPASPEPPGGSGSPSRPGAAPSARPTIPPAHTERPSPTRR